MAAGELLALELGREVPLRHQQALAEMRSLLEEAGIKSMQAKMRLRAMAWIASWLGWLCLGSPSVFAQALPDQASLTNALLVRACASDATLNSVAVVSADHLCAVGNCGVILLSENGGRAWDSVECPSTANLHAVAFVDAEHGVAVGGSIGGYSRTSSGVILRTSDGGKTWVSLPNELPRLMGLAIHGQRLTAWGDYSPQHASGVHHSMDLGATWQPGRSALAHVLAFGNSRMGVSQAVDSLGRSQLSNAVNSETLTIGHANAKIRVLHHTDEFWLAGGEYGELIQSFDGRAWSNVSLPLSAVARRVCCWQTISQVANEIWVGGYPGSILLYSRDRGATWTIRPTGQSLPISQMQFIDQHRGWSVGPLGRILATRDGGATWHAQRREVSRVGVLSVVASTEQIPWSPLIASVWDDRIAATALVVGPSDPVNEASFLPSQAAQLQEIAPQLGFSLAVQNDSDATANSLADELATALMTWRPNVVLTDEAGRVGSQTPASGRPQLATVLLTAIQMARSLEAAGSLAKELRLQPWLVDKLVSVTQSERLQYSEQSQRVMRSVGLAIWDVLLALPPEHRVRVASMALRTQWTESHNRAANASLLGGVAPSNETARKIVTQGIGNYQLVMGRVHRQKSVEQLVNYAGSDASWEQDLDFVLETLPYQELVPVLWDLSQRIAVPQYFTRQLRVLEQLVERAPGSDGARWAMLELLRLSGSDEVAAWLQAQGRREPVPIALAGHVSPRSDSPGNPGDLSGKPWNQTPFGSHDEDIRPGIAVVSASASKAISHPETAGPHTANEITQQTQAWFERLNRFNQMMPRLVSRPDVQMMSHRRSTFPLGPSVEWAEENRLESLTATSQLLGWPQVAGQETRLSMSRVEDLRWIALAAPAAQRPQLDGHLNEAIWNAVPPMKLTGFGDTAEATTVRWAFDESYLYLALECPIGRPATQLPVQRLRSYDSDLTGTDHVQILMDTDRDYASAIELAIGQDGRTYDRCCGRSDYDPKWHVLVQTESQLWKAEIAIELKYLTTQKELTGAAWAISARRIKLDESTQSWSQLRTHQPLLESSGLLLFLPAE